MQNFSKMTVWNLPVLLSLCFCSFFEPSHALLQQKHHVCRVKNNGIFLQQVRLVGVKAAVTHTVTWSVEPPPTTGNQGVGVPQRDSTTPTMTRTWQHHAGFSKDMRMFWSPVGSWECARRPGKTSLPFFWQFDSDLATDNFVTLQDNEQTHKCHLEMVKWWQKFSICFLRPLAESRAALWSRVSAVMRGRHCDCYVPRQFLRSHCTSIMSRLSQVASLKSFRNWHRRWQEAA